MAAKESRLRDIRWIESFCFYHDILWPREDVLSAVPVIIRKYLIGTHRRFLCWPHKPRLEGGQYA
jgi:hypothetical protein